MALEEYRPGTTFPGVIGRTFDQSSPAWPQPLRARYDVSGKQVVDHEAEIRTALARQ